MFRNQLSALLTHERIITTVAKAKELRPLAERMVTLARTNTIPARRKVLQTLPDKTVVRRLFDDIAPRFMERPGGYTRILRLGRRRGDGAELAIIEFVDFEPERKGEGGGGKKQSLMDRAKGMFGGGKKAAAAPAAEESVAEAAEGIAEPEVEAAAAEPEAEAEDAGEDADDVAEEDEAEDDTKS
jgi:large subunit ribosomal protein L17